MSDYEAKYTNLVKDIEKLIADAAKSEPEIAEEIHEKFDAAIPVLDEVQDILADVDEVIEEETGADVG